LKSRVKEICSNIAIGAGYLATGILISYVLMSTAADQQRKNEAKYEAQLNKCHGGNFCQITAKEKSYRFLTLSARSVNK